MFKSGEDSKVYKIALLVSMSCVLQISESMVPHPIPGLRLGLANMLTLVALVTLGFKYALQIAVYRTILSSFIVGTFMSPTFILSFSGAVVSSAVMGLLYWLSGHSNRYRFSLIGISILGALSHNMVQLSLAYLILVKHKGIFVFFPWLSIGAVVMGWITGAVAARVCRQLKDVQEQKIISDVVQNGSSAPYSHHYSPGSSFLHRTRPEAKILIIGAVSLVLLLSANLIVCLGLFLSLLAVVAFSNTPVSFLLLRVRKYSSLVFVAFSLPLFFNAGTHIIFETPYFRLTQEGLSTGAVFSFRIIFLIFVSSILVRTTSPAELTAGLAKALSFLRYAGISEKRVAMLLSLSWVGIPFFWETARATIRSANVKKTKNLRRLIPVLSNLIAKLYLEATPENDFWKGAYFEQQKNLMPQSAKSEAVK